MDWLLAYDKFDNWNWTFFLHPSYGLENSIELVLSFG